MGPSKVFSSVPHNIKWRLGEKAYGALNELRKLALGARIDTVHLDEHRFIEYMEIDRGKDETILFLHGFADSKETFFEAAAHLVNDYNIICPDLPGFGSSFKLRHETYSLENYGEWIQQFVEEINLDRFHLAGNSLGGAIAAQLALLCPERVENLVLVDAAGVYIDSQHTIHHELFDGHVIFDVSTHSEFEYFLNRVFTKQPFIPGPIKEYIFREFSKHGLWHRKVLSDLIKGLDSKLDPKVHDMALNNRLKNIEMPTLLLWGDDDSFFPKETAMVMHQEIPNSEVRLLCDVGHCPQIEVPKRFAKAMKKFLHQQSLTRKSHMF